MDVNEIQAELNRVISIDFTIKELDSQSRKIVDGLFECINLDIDIEEPKKEEKYKDSIDEMHERFANGFLGFSDRFSSKDDDDKNLYTRLTDIECLEIIGLRVRQLIDKRESIVKRLSKSGVKIS